MITGKTIGQFAGYSVASVIAPLIPFAVLSAISFVVFVLIGIIPLLMWVAPILVLAHAVKKRSTGGILGALCGLPLLFAYFEIALSLEAERIQALDQRSILPPQQAHRVLVIEDSYFGTLEGTESCNEICLQILFDGRYVPVLAQSDGDVWRVFRLAHGQDCVASPRASRYLELLGRRYTDVCISVSDETPQSDALVVREHFSRESQVWQELPHRSGVREYLERIDNQDHVLSRWIMAILEQSGPWSVFWGIRTRAIGEPLEDEKFYAAVLGMPIEKHVPQGNAPVPDILNELKPVLDDPQVANQAMSTLERVAITGTEVDRAEVRSFIMVRINEMKASSNPDANHLRRLEKLLTRF